MSKWIKEYCDRLSRVQRRIPYMRRMRLFVLSERGRLGVGSDAGELGTGMPARVQLLA
jgi:hypothetical protein